MSETDSHGQKPKISKLAIGSLSLGVLCFLILYFRNVIFHPWWARVLVWHSMLLLGIAGLVIGVVALVRIKRSGWMLKGGGLTIAGIVLAISISQVWFFQMSPRLRPRFTGRRPPGWYNLWELGRAMSIYAKDHGHYPEPDKWCDLLLAHGEVDIKRFACPSIVLRWPSKVRREFIWPAPKKGRCYFAMNPNCQPNSPNDVVLLFESGEGWNMFGSGEMLITDRGRRGCNILFKNGSVEFTKPQEFKELNWGNERRKKAER